ncbi:hypothetical protein KZ813_02035 [Sphingomonas sp. RHCKR7]|uniref:hypothetical protein n=1 Tax=Sphingomonas folli TaxID=2862497 RepID=UPI001CA4E79B|nr:hypothetical protein [Sphingomonas folli]MBW6525613.1 hypothetical protein [Sphingomonas folli]
MTGAALALALMLSACGDDGKNAKASSAASSSKSGTTSPTPTPSPTPRTYSYDKAANLTIDRTFTGYDRFSSAAVDGKFKTVDFSSSDSAVTSFVRSDSKITFADSSDLPNGGVFSFPGISGGSGIHIQSGGRLVALELPGELSSYQYFLFAEYADAGTYRHFVIGAPTNPAEINGTGTLTYSALIGEEFNKSGVKPAPLTVDLAKSIVSGTVPLIQDGGKATDVTLTGSIDATKHIKGTLQSSDGKLTGEFRGRPFGPGGKELALVVALKKEDGTLASTRLTATLKQ